MANINLVVLSGNIARDIAVSKSSNGELTIARTSLAVNSAKKEAPATFANLTMFGKTAEFAEKYLGKGRKVVVRGSLQTSEYTDKNGQKAYDWTIVVEGFDFADSKGQGQSTAETEGQTETEGGDSFMNIPDGMPEELPWN